jgi:DNA-binding GntR family transcriptional regulator
MSSTAPTAAMEKEKPPVRKTAQNVLIYEEMLTAILEQRLAPGTKLSEDTLGGIFGVSRSVIRTVLHQLGHERIVQIQPNRGAFVAEPSHEEAREVLQARRLIEEGVVRLAVNRHTKMDIINLRDMVSEEQASLDTGNHKTWVRQSGDFHVRLAKIAGNHTLKAYVKELVSRNSLIIVQFQKGNLSSCSCDEHSGIIDAIAARNEDLAVKLMMEHLQACENQLNLNGGEPKSDLHAVFSRSAGK